MEPWQPIGAADEFGGDKLRRVELGERVLCVGRSGEAYFAVDDLCPHAGGSLADGIVLKQQLICPLHGYAFDVRTGACPDDPRCDIRSYETRVEAGVLQVRVGDAEPKEA